MSKVDSPNPPASTNKEYLYSTVHHLGNRTESGSPAHTYTECLLFLFSCFCACYCCSLSPRRLLYSGKRRCIRELEQRCLATSGPVYGPHIVMGIFAFKTLLKVKKRNSANSCGMGNLKKKTQQNLCVYLFILFSRTHPFVPFSVSQSTYLYACFLSFVRLSCPCTTGKYRCGIPGLCAIYVVTMSGTISVDMAAIVVPLYNYTTGANSCVVVVFTVVPNVWSSDEGIFRISVL